MTLKDSQNKAGGLSPIQTVPTSPSARNWRLNATKHATLISIHKTLVKGNKHWIAPSVNRLRELLYEFHGIDIGRRWCFQCLADLRTAGFVWRKKRPRRMPDNTVRSRPGLIGITLRGFAYLASKGTEKVKEARQKIIDWLHRGDHRFPGPSDILLEEETTERSTALARLQEMYAKIGAGPAGGRTPAAT